MARGSVLAIDPGSKRTGFAVTDALRLTFEPLGTFQGPEGGERLLDHIAELVRDRVLECLLVGNPLGRDGQPTERSRAAEELCARLARRFPALEIVRYDERLTTKEAQSRLVEAGHTGARRKAAKDAWSAAVLLEDWVRSGEPR